MYRGLEEARGLFGSRASGTKVYRRNYQRQPGLSSNREAKPAFSLAAENITFKVSTCNSNVDKNNSFVS